MVHVDSSPPEALSGAPILDPGVPGQPMTVTVEFRHGADLVRIKGELDAASRESVTSACSEGCAGTVIVDLSALTFLDTGGHGGLAAARNILAQQGRALELVGAVGEPRRLLDLIDLIDQVERS